MDNLTHSLVGLLCAEAAVRARERANSKQPLSAFGRSAVYAFAIIGNNLPDLDVAYAGASDKAFGYLLQHRGYTHTLPAALGFAAAMLVALVLLARWRKQPVSAAEWRLLASVAVLSPVLHIAMDFANNYGVHPFWPLDERWFYGDTLFIVEPSLWLVLIAPLSFSYRSPWLRGTLWLVLGAALAALWYRPFVPRGHALLLTLLTVTLLVVARWRSPGARFLLAAVGFLALGLAFVVGSRFAKAMVRERAELLFPSAKTLDVVATPMPANPFCWSVILVQLDGAQYSARLGRVATWPAWLSVAQCPFDQGAVPTAPLRSLPVVADSRVSLTNEFLVPVAELRDLAVARCEAAAFFHFARVPYLSAAEPDGSRVLGDLRYDRKRGLDFSDLRLMRAQGKCPEHVPPWRFPRADILSVEY